MAEKIGTAVLELTTNKDQFLGDVAKMAGGAGVLGKSFGQAQLQVKGLSGETDHLGKAMVAMSKTASATVGTLTQTDNKAKEMTADFRTLGQTAPGVFVEIAN